MTRARAVILVSPAPVDGYPPVQSQARLLAGAGFDVAMVTRPLPGRSYVAFAHPGVDIFTSVGQPKRTSRAAPVQRLWERSAFLFQLTRARISRRGQIATEIAYDPDGMWMSDIAPFRPTRRVAHFHEMVMRLDNHPLERRLPRAVQQYQRVIVPDEGRASALRAQLCLTETPTTVPNLPVAESVSDELRQRNPPFEVIYAGSLGIQQMLDLIIRSVSLWPETARLTLLGDDSRPTARILKRLANDLGLVDRVTFEGWLELPDLIPRLQRAHLGISLLTPEFPQWVLSVGASNKRYQFMQAGLPQIGDMLPGVPELLEENGVGRCVRDYSERNIADLVTYYLDHEQEREDAGRRAEQLHRERYNYQAVFAPIIDWIRADA